MEDIGSFWPTSLNDLLGVLAVLFAFIGGAAATVLRYVRRPLSIRIDDHDKLFGALNEALDNIRNAARAIELRMTAQEQEMRMANVDRINLHESVSRISSEMQTLLKIAQSTQIERVEDLSEIRERLVRIETKVDDAKFKI